MITSNNRPVVQIVDESGEISKGKGRLYSALATLVILTVVLIVAWIGIKVFQAVLSIVSIGVMLGAFALNVRVFFSGLHRIPKEDKGKTPRQYFAEANKKKSESDEEIDDKTLKTWLPVVSFLILSILLIGDVVFVLVLASYALNPMYQHPINVLGFVSVSLILFNSFRTLRGIYEFFRLMDEPVTGQTVFTFLFIKIQALSVCAYIVCLGLIAFGIIR